MIVIKVISVFSGFLLVLEDLGQLPHIPKLWNWKLTPVLSQVHLECCSLRKQTLKGVFKIVLLIFNKIFLNVHICSKKYEVIDISIYI